MATGLPGALAVISGAGVAAPLPTIDPQSIGTSLDARALDASLATPISASAGRAAEPDASELACMAKVVFHEAANQSREGQLAVAQLMMNRKQSGRFAATICGVAAQRGQFFDVTSYSPRRDARWDMAMDVSRAAMTGTGDDIVPGALFYHAATNRTSQFFRTRQKVASLGAHVFYR